MATSVVHRISVCDADDFDTVLAALRLAKPDLNSNYAATTFTGAGCFCIGSRDRGDGADIDSESVEATPIVDGVTVRPAGSLNATKYITRHNGIEEITWTCYDVAQDVFELDSNASTDESLTSECQRSTTQTNRAVFIEYDGIRLDCYPNVVLHISAEPGGFGPGDDAVNKYTFTGQVLGTDDIPSGQLKIHYVAAGT